MIIGPINLYIVLPKPAAAIHIEDSEIESSSIEFEHVFLLNIRMQKSFHLFIIFKAF